MSMLKIRPETEVLAEISGYLSAYIQGRLAFKLFRRTGNPVVCLPFDQSRLEFFSPNAHLSQSIFLRVQSNWLRTYPNRPAARQVMKLQAKCSMAR